MLRAVRRRLRIQDGVSLVEMMVAVTVVSVALAALASALITAIQATHGQRLRNVATRVMSEQFENLRAQGFETLQASLTSGTLTTTDTLTQDGDDYTVQTVLTETDVDGDTATPLDTVIDATVTVTWNEFATVRTTTSTTSIAPSETVSASTGGTTAAIGDVTFSPSIAMVDTTSWQTVQDVTVVVPLTGVPSNTDVTLSWTDDNGVHTRTRPYTNGPTAEFTLAAGVVEALIPAADASREVPFTVTVLTQSKGASLPLQRQPATALSLSGATISPGTIDLTDAHKTQGCSQNKACVNRTAVTFTVTVDGFDNSQNSDSVKVRYILENGNQEELALVRDVTSLSPATGVGTSVWTATVPPETVKFAHPDSGVANETFTFMATRHTDDPATVVQLDVAHPVEAPVQP